MGIPEEFPKVGSVYPGVLHMPKMVAEFQIETFEETTGIYSGSAFSYRVVLPMTDEILYCHHFSHQPGNLIQLQKNDLIWSTPEGFRQTGKDLKVSFAYDTQLRGSGISGLCPSRAEGHWSYIQLPQEKKQSQIELEQHGLFYFNHGKVIQFTEFPPDLWIDQFMEDAQGNLWFASTENGLYLFIPPYVDNHSKKSVTGLYYPEVSSRHQRRERKIKLGSYEEEPSKDLLDLNQDHQLPHEFQELIIKDPAARTQLLMEFVPLGSWENHLKNSEFYAVVQGSSMGDAIAAGIELPPIPVLVEVNQSEEPQWYFCPELPKSYKHFHSGGISSSLGIYLATDAGTLRLPPKSSAFELWEPESSCRPMISRITS